MSSRQKNAMSGPMRRTRKRHNSQTRLHKPHNHHKNTTTLINVESCSSVSEKLEALKSLIPTHVGEGKPDQLFQETADYIVLLKTQVSILQRLVDFYGSSQTQNALY
ncbi:unnamed protein product [Camellia sinensis]